MDWSEAVGLAKEGKEDGFDFLYKQTYQRSYYIALKYTKQEETACDVLQDAYIKAFQSLEQLQDADKFAAWFSRIVATKALDELKKRNIILFSQMQTEGEEIRMEELLADDRTDTQPELVMDQEETSRLVMEIINTLSDEQRMCVMMFYMEQMSVKDIAQILNVSENTVKSRLKYGRKNIEDKVLELEKKGTKLYGIAPFPFFLYLLFREVESVQAATIPLSKFLEKKMLPENMNMGRSLSPTGAGPVTGTFPLRKVLVGAVLGMAVCGGVAVMVHLVGAKNAGESTAVMEIQTEYEQKVSEDFQTEEMETEMQIVQEAQEDSVNEAWKDAYIAFAGGLAENANGYALLDVEGSEVPLLAVLPDIFSVTGETGDSVTYRLPYFLQLYYYDAELGEVKQIMQADSDGANGALVDAYMEMGFYLAYLSNERLLVGDLVGSSAVIETYSFDANTGHLKAADTYVDEQVETVAREDIMYYRTVEAGIEHIGAVQK